MFKYIIVFSALFLNFTFSYDTGSIQGKVTDASSGTAVAAEVRLYRQSDSSFVQGTKCGPDGKFTFDELLPASYRLELTAPEYSTVNISNIDVKPGRVDLDTIKLNKNEITTDVIEVEAEKNLIQFSEDKKIFNVDKSILSKGGTAIDVLKKTPLVDVDINDNVSLRGSQNVKILIDDKPMRFASLKQVPANAIDRIELITNPPAKYEAEGVTGIINIVMKKNDNLGYTGNFNGGGNYADRISGWGGLDINLKSKSSGFFGNLYSGSWNNNFLYDNNTYYLTEPVSSVLTSGDGRNKGYWIWGQGGYEYELAPGKTIGMDASISTGQWYNVDLSQSDVLNGSGLLSYYYIEDGGRNGLWENINGSAYFNNKLNDAGREWTGNITFSRNRNTNFMNQVTQYYDSLSAPANNTPFDQRDSTRMKIYNLNVQTDYTHPLSKDSKFETGYKGTFRVNDNSFSSDTMNYNMVEYVTNMLTANRFKLSEYINAAYVMYSNSLAGFNIKLGLRTEHTYAKGELSNDNSSFTQNYIDFFPSVNINRKFGAANQLQLSYSRRITRPNVWRLNPFYRSYSQRFSLVGNPNLTPEYTDSYEVSYMLITPVITITPLGFFRQTHDVISSYSYLVDSNVSLMTFRNAAGSKAYGMDLLLNTSAISWLSINGTVSLYNTKFDSDPSLTDYSAEEGFSWRANLRTTLSFPGLFNVEMFYRYNGKKVNFQGTETPSQNFDIGISKSFLDDALNVSMRLGDVFNTASFGQDVDASGYATKFRYNWASRHISLNVSYRFGNTDKQLQKQKKVKQNQNEKTDQDNNGQGQ